MILEKVGTALLEREIPDPVPARGQIKVRVLACAICRTDRHVIEGDLPNPKLPLVPGHEIVGQVVECGPGVTGFDLGSRVGGPRVEESDPLLVASPCRSPFDPSRHHGFPIRIQPCQSLQCSHGFRGENVRIGMFEVTSDFQLSRCHE